MTVGQKLYKIDYLGHWRNFFAEKICEWKYNERESIFWIQQLLILVSQE